MQTPTILKKRPSVDAAQRAAGLKQVSLELITPSWEIRTEDLMEVLSDERDFLVVGVLGTQGSGKSTLVNHLCDLCPCMTKAGTWAPEAGEQLWSPVQTQKAAGSVSHVTRAVEVRVRPGDRIIALDSPPLLSPSMLADMATGAHAVSGLLPLLLKCAQDGLGRDSRSVSAEAAQYIMALQSMIFFLSVCHVVVVMVDSLDHSALTQLLLLSDLIAGGMPDVAVAGTVSSTKLPQGRTADCVLVLSAPRPLMSQPYVINPQLELCSSLLADSAFARSGAVLEAD